MRRESFRILKVFIASLLFFVTPFNCSSICAPKRWELYCVYIRLLSHAGTAELAAPWSRGSFAAEQGHRCYISAST